MQIIFLGTGTSHGVPEIGCECEVCKSYNKKDKRTRSSIIINVNSKNILIDSGPDLRFQILRENIKKIDAVIYTHVHSDHISGIDDLRKFNCIYKNSIPIYAKKEYIEILKKKYEYINFNGDFKWGATPQLNPIEISGNFKVFDIEFEEIPILHGDELISGFRFLNNYYFTDCSGVPDESLSKIINPNLMIVGALRQKPHYKHFSFYQACDFIKKYNSKGYLTHISHKLSDEFMRDNSDLDIEPAYDGLRVDI